MNRYVWGVLSIAFFVVGMVMLFDDSSRPFSPAPLIGSFAASAHLRCGLLERRIKEMEENDK